MNLLIVLLQEININEKLKEAPDSSYGVGVFIGTMLPFVILVVIAFTIYRYNKNKIKDN
jgi:p-aminobenzoyl-glutamate transporter AbgT